jgi:hypothetical protein
VFSVLFVSDVLQIAYAKAEESCSDRPVSGAARS